MGILFAFFGLILMIPVIMFVTMCVANIVFVDSLAAAILSGVLAGTICHAHPVICIIISIVILAGMTYLYLHDKAFMVLTLLSTASWAYLTGFFVHDLTGGDMLWTLFFAVISGGIILTLHLGVRMNWRSI